MDASQSEERMEVPHLRQSYWGSILEEEEVLHPQSSSSQKLQLTVLDEVLKGEIASTKPSGWGFSKFSVKTPQTIPQQPNLYDCGVCMINIMESRDMSELTPGKFRSEDERARLILKMVMSNFNRN